MLALYAFDRSYTPPSQDKAGFTYPACQPASQAPPLLPSPIPSAPQEQGSTTPPPPPPIVAIENQAGFGLFLMPLIENEAGEFGPFLMPLIENPVIWKTLFRGRLGVRGG